MAGPSATCVPMNLDVGGMPVVWSVGPGEGLACVTVRDDKSDVPCGLFEGSFTVGAAIPVSALFYVNASPAA